MKSAFESMMFVWGEPLEAKAAAEVFNISVNEAYDCFQELAEEYEQEGRGIRIREIDKRFQFVTAYENADYIQRLCTPVREKRLSQSALEVLAIVAYKQPVTRAEIESIRGIKCDRVLESLGKRELIREVGRSNGIGRPILYGTTESFLRYFGFKDLKDLPEIEDIAGVINTEEDDAELQGSLEMNQLSLNLEPMFDLRPEAASDREAEADAEAEAEAETEAEAASGYDAEPATGVQPAEGREPKTELREDGAEEA